MAQFYRMEDLRRQNVPVVLSWSGREFVGVMVYERYVEHHGHRRVPKHRKAYFEITAKGERVRLPHARDNTTSGEVRSTMDWHPRCWRPLDPRAWPDLPPAERRFLEPAAVMLSNGERSLPPPPVAPPDVLAAWELLKAKAGPAGADVVLTLDRHAVTERVLRALVELRLSSTRDGSQVVALHGGKISWPSDALGRGVSIDVVDHVALGWMDQPSFLFPNGLPSLRRGRVERLEPGKLGEWDIVNLYAHRHAWTFEKIGKLMGATHVEVSRRYRAAIEHCWWVANEESSRRAAGR